VVHQQDPPGLHLPLPVDSDVDWEPVPGARVPHLAPRVVAAVFAGGCAGGLARHGLMEALPAGATDWPWAVLVANIAGAFLLGLLLVLVLEVWQGTALLRPFLGTGFCGGFTTMSAVAVTTDRWLADGDAARAVGYDAATVVAGLLAAFGGLLVARGIVVRRTAVRG
jgi:CrcB protein